MENPASWGPVERTIKRAMDRYEENRAKGIIGLSPYAVIANELRAAGLLVDHD